MIDNTKVLKLFEKENQIFFKESLTVLLYL
jgi:hypothetical protein